MSTIKEAESPAKPAKPRATSPYVVVRNTLLIASLIAMLALFALGIAQRILNPFGDFAVGNIVMLVCTFLGVLAPVTWLAVFACRGWMRLLPHTALFLVMASPFTLFKIREVGGEMIPVFAWRFAPDPDEQLALPPTAVDEVESRIEIVTTTGEDFPRFLGVDGTNHIHNVQLLREWNARPPKRLWRQQIGAGWSSFAVVNGFAVTMEQRGPQELVTCYDVQTGELLWSHGVEARYETILGGIGPRATPTIHEGKVYANGATGILRCLDGATGKLLWQKDLLKELGIPADYDAKSVDYGRANSPLVYDKLVVVPGGAGPNSDAMTNDATTLVAFHKDTGQLAWRGGHEQIGYASPVLTTLDDVQHVISVNEDTVSGHDALDGRELWQFDWPGGSSTDSNNSQPVPVGNNRILVSKSYGIGAALMEIRQTPAGKWTTKELWHNAAVLKTKFTNVVVDDGYIYGLSDGILECVDLANGERVWKKGRFHQGQILGVGDVLLVVDETSGEVSMIDLSPDGYKQLGKFAALDSTKVWNHLALYGNLLLVRDAQNVACWQLPAK